MKLSIITRSGFNKLVAQLNNHLKIDLPAIAIAITAAQGSHSGNLSENGELMDACSTLTIIEKKIKDLEYKILMSKIVDLSSLKKDGIVKFGTTVKVRNIKTNKMQTLLIAGTNESDVTNGVISLASPFAKEIMGLCSGDFFDCNDIEYEIISANIIYEDHC